jgi:hypothetical protein
MREASAKVLLTWNTVDFPALVTVTNVIGGLWGRAVEDLADRFATKTL